MGKPTKTELTKMNKSQLEDALKLISLSHVGTRPELKSRLVDYYYGEKKIDVVDKCNEVKDNKMEVDDVRCKDQKVKKKPPSKSSIKTMKKADLKSALCELGLCDGGDKTQMVERLENYYRPTNPVLPAMNKPNCDDKNFDEVANIINNPSTSQIQSMDEEEIKKYLRALALDVGGAKIELIRRLEEYYRPSKNVKLNDDVPKKKNTTYKATVTMSVIPYKGQQIGIDIDTMEVYEKRGEQWFETDLTWNMETNSYNK